MPSQTPLHRPWFAILRQHTADPVMRMHRYLCTSTTPCTTDHPVTLHIKQLDCHAPSLSTACPLRVQLTIGSNLSSSCSRHIHTDTQCHNCVYTQKRSTLSCTIQTQHSVLSFIVLRSSPCQPYAPSTGSCQPQTLSTPVPSGQDGSGCSRCILAGRQTARWLPHSAAQALCASMWHNT